jgi:hypothetical protein
MAVAEQLGRGMEIPLVQSPLSPHSRGNFSLTLAVPPVAGSESESERYAHSSRGASDNMQKKPSANRQYS